MQRELRNGLDHGRQGAVRGRLREGDDVWGKSEVQENVFTMQKTWIQALEIIK